MAKFGLKGFWVCPVDDDDNTGITYESNSGKKIAKAVTLSESRQYDEAKLYADNGLDDSVKAINTMEINITPNGIDYDDLATLIGLTKVTTGEDASAVTDYYTTAYDEGAAVGVGYVVQNRTSGSNSYTAGIYLKVKFSPSDSAEYNTRGDSAEFVTESYTGSCYITAKGYYKREEIFDTEADAEAWVEDILEVPSA